MYKYKIVASDLDGTLLNNKSEISKENLEAIKELNKKGVHFVISSGRTFAEIPKEICENDDIRYIIHSNGAVIFDKKENKRIYTCISNETMQKILEIVKDYQLYLTIRYQGNCCVDENYQTEKDYEFYNVDPCHIFVVNHYGKFVKNFPEYVRNADNVEVVSVFFRDLEEKKACGKRLSEIKEVFAAEAAINNFEIFSADAGKGKALYQLADMLGVEHNATISLGDSGNDMTITQAAGLGLAVSNSSQILKDVADGIICSNEEHVAKYVLEKYFD